MKITERLLDTLKAYESYARKLANGDCEAYPDPASKADGKPWTIGWGTTTYNVGGKTKYGRTLVQKGDTLTREQAEAEFIYDVNEVAKKVEAIGVTLNQNEFEACMSFFCNAGFPAPMVARLKRSKSEFCDALDLYVRGENGSVVPGLVRRRNEEQALFRTPALVVNVANTDWYLLSSTGLYGMKGDKATETVRTWPSSEPVKQLQHNMIVNLERGAPTFWEAQLERDFVKPDYDLTIAECKRSTSTSGMPAQWTNAGLVPLSVRIGDQFFVCVSGQGYAQNFRLPADPKSFPGNMEPIPQGSYTIQNISWAGGKDNWSAIHNAGIGPVFVPFVAKFSDDRGAFGFHQDHNINNAPGSAGCIVFASLDETKRAVAALRKFDPKTLKVNWNL